VIKQIFEKHGKHGNTELKNKGHSFSALSAFSADIVSLLGFSMPACAFSA